MLSATTLTAVENGDIEFPMAATIDAIEIGFEAFGLRVEAEDLERAWIGVAPEAAPRWLADHASAAGMPVRYAVASLSDRLLELVNTESLPITAPAAASDARLSRIPPHARTRRIVSALIKVGGPVADIVARIAPDKAAHSSERAEVHFEIKPPPDAGTPEAEARLLRFVEAHAEALAKTAGASSASVPK